MGQVTVGLVGLSQAFNGSHEGLQAGEWHGLIYDFERSHLLLCGEYL